MVHGVGEPANRNGKLPDGVLDILPRSRTDTVFLLGRTGVNNSSEADLASANEIQDQYILTPLSAVWARNQEIARFDASGIGT